MNAAQQRGLSVIIPVAGRLVLVEELLQSVQRARSCFSDPCEVLLLDNSAPHERERMRQLACAYCACYQIGSDNLSAKRNEGIRAARYDIVLFLDSDCTIAPDLLVEHYRLYDDPAVIGCLGVLRFQGQETFAWRAVARTSVLDCFSLPDIQPVTTWGPTANLSFRRAALQAINGFDEAFARPGGEDVDLGFRLSNVGWSIVCNPKAIAYHSRQTWASLGQIWRRFVTYGQADTVLIRKHPARTVWDLPTPLHLLAMVMILALGAALTSGERWLLTLPLAWVVLLLAIYGWLSLYRGQQPMTLSGFLEQVTALVLLSALDLGRLGAAITRCHWSGLYRRVVFFDEQQVVDWPDVSLSSLAGLSALFIVLFGMTFGLTR